MDVVKLFEKLGLEKPFKSWYEGEIRVMIVGGVMMKWYDCYVRGSETL
jgi:hypothetical protein